MKNRELIAQLLDFHPDAEVMILFERLGYHITKLDYHNYAVYVVAETELDKDCELQGTADPDSIYKNIKHKLLGPELPEEIEDPVTWDESHG